MAGQSINLTFQDKVRLDQRVEDYILTQLRTKFGESFQDVEEEVISMMKGYSLSELKVITLDLINEYKVTRRKNSKV